MIPLYSTIVLYDTDCKLMSFAVAYVANMQKIESSRNIKMNFNKTVSCYSKLIA